MALLRWQRVNRIGVALAIGAVALTTASGAFAYKPTSHLYAADQSIALILGDASTNTPGRNAVNIDGREYAVPDAVGNSIRAFPDYYRGGVVGPDAFPDIPGGQSNIHPDTRTDNGTRPDRGPGHGYSFTYEWLAHVYQSGWTAYNGCNGCPSGQQALAFTYGYLNHAAGDLWSHTLINSFAGGVFPAYADMLRSTPKARIGFRHIIVEGYIDQHAPALPAAAYTINAPTDFIYSTFIDNPTAAALGRGPFIDGFVHLREHLVSERLRVLADIATQDQQCKIRVNGKCKLAIPDPADAPFNVFELATLLAEKPYLDAWIPDITRGLKAYPKLSLQLGRAMLVTKPVDLDGASAAAKTYVNDYLLSMIGLPDAVGIAIGQISKFSDWLDTQLGYLTTDYKQLQQKLVNWVIRQAFGIDPQELKAILENAQAYINSTADKIALGPGTSANLDALMGLKVDGTTPANLHTPFDPERFAIMHNTIALGKLALLSGSGLSAVLADHGAPTRLYVPLNKTSTVPTNVMLGWIRCIDCDHQWRKISTRDKRQYGEGTFPLWQNCTARDRVFRVVFQDWENGASNFPDLGDACTP